MCHRVICVTSARPCTNILLCDIVICKVILHAIVARVEKKIVHGNVIGAWKHAYGSLKTIYIIFAIVH